MEKWLFIIVEKQFSKWMQKNTRKLYRSGEMYSCKFNNETVEN